LIENVVVKVNKEIKYPDQNVPIKRSSYPKFHPPKLTKIALYHTDFTWMGHLVIRNH